MESRCVWALRLESISLEMAGMTDHQRILTSQKTQTIVGKEIFSSSYSGKPAGMVQEDKNVRNEF